MTSGMTLAEVAAGSPTAVSVLERYGLDYCCGGKEGFEQACLAKGLDPQSVAAEILGSGTAGADGRDWRAAPLRQLVAHIVSAHHEYLKLELPALGKRMQKVLEVHGERDPQTLGRMSEVFAALREELELHLHKEEAILFPFIEQYGQAEAQGVAVPPVPFGSIAHPIAVMEREHDSAGRALAQLRALTHNYELPEYACSTVAALLQGLDALERDLHLHIHLENNILFPRAISLEQRR